ncbi:MAG: hypothetical protein JW702_11045 [Clostridiales bacterium]|nr:hypothetical protein [Clostridiales bacterium]
MNKQPRKGPRRFPNKQGMPTGMPRQRAPMRRNQGSAIANRQIGQVNKAKTNGKFTPRNLNQQIANVVQTMEKSIQQLQQENTALKNKLGQTEKTTKTLQTENYRLPDSM